MALRFSSRDAAYTAIVVVIACFIFVAARHIRSYFFLFDDFALVAAAEAYRPFDIFTRPLFGFFRPLAFLTIEPFFAMSGWTVAWPYAAFAVAVHLLNSILVFSLAVRLGLPRLPAALGGTLFLLSASAAESYFWLSAVFDRLATTGLLLCILAGLSFCRSIHPARAAGWLMAGVLAGMAAVLFKETGVVAPVVFLAAARLDDRVPMSKSFVYAACLVLPCGLYLTLRNRVLPGLGGSYGPFGELVAKADLFKNLVTYIRGSLVVPLPALDEAHAMYVALAIAPAALVAAWAVLLSQCAQRRLRWLLLCATSWAAVIVPVLWTPITPGSSAGGRFLYTAGIWIALTIAGAAEGIRLVSASRWTRARAIITACSVAIVFLYHTASVAYQARIWAQASLLSRAAIEQLRPYQGSGKNVYIPNMPFWFVEGPYVLKDYAFTSYFGSRFGTTIRARPMVVSWQRGQVRFAGWAGDQRSESASSRNDEVTVPLALPIQFPTPQPQAEIISPRVGASLKQPFRMLGWAVDTGAITGCGVDSVHIWAHAENRSPAFLGTAEIGGAAPEAEERVGKRYRRCGWSFRVQGLETGRYMLAAHPHDTVTGGFTAASVVSVQVR